MGKEAKRGLEALDMDPGSASDATPLCAVCTTILSDHLIISAKGLCVCMHLRPAGFFAVYMKRSGAGVPMVSVLVQTAIVGPPQAQARQGTHSTCK